MTLGRHSGAALLGRPLDIRVQARLAPGEKADELCVRPEVFYGDSQVSASSVTLTWQHSAPDAAVSLRIQSSQPINEPIVMVNVGVGCTSVFSRRYVLLADPEPIGEAAADSGRGAAVPPSLPVAGTALPPAGDAPAAAASPGTSASRGGAAAAPRRPARLARDQAAAVARDGGGATPRSSVVRKPEPAPAAGPRLMLDPLEIDLLAERDPVLRLSTVLLAEPQEGDTPARQAAIRLWKAVNASPEDVLRDMQRMDELEAESKTLRELEARSRERLEVLEANAEKGERFRWISYGLLGALLLALLLLAALWRRRRPEDDNAGMPAWAGAMAGRRKEPQVSGVAADRRAITPVDIELGFDDDGASRPGGPDDDLLDLSAPDAGPGLRREFAPPAPPARSMATEELFDVQQQADFFMSLGKHEEAIRVLKEHLSESQGPSPLAYLDLLHIYHQLGRRDEYEALRSDFNQLFNAGAPPFGQYSSSNRGLDTYEQAFSRIQALWPQSKVLDLIERSIFRDDQMAGEEVFDLEAYRELLLLHAVAKDMIERDAAQSHTDFQHTSLKPLNAAPGRPPGEDLLDRATEPLGPEAGGGQELSDIGLDIDLENLSDISAFEASLPEVGIPVEPTARPPAPSDGNGNLIDFELLDFTPPPEAGEGRREGKGSQG